jgi:hypothetical protein
MEKYIVDNSEVSWKDYKKICTMRCKNENKKMGGLINWMTSGSTVRQRRENNDKLKTHLSIAKPRPRDKPVTFTVPDFTNKILYRSI